MSNEMLQRMIDYHTGRKTKSGECMMPLTEEQMHHDPNYSRGSIQRSVDLHM